MLFNGLFNDLTVAQCVALCSCFVVTENVKEDAPKLAQDLAGPFKVMQVSHHSLLERNALITKLNSLLLKY